MTTQTFQFISAVAQDCIALTLFAWPLTRRSFFGVRLAFTGAFILAMVTAAINKGFTLYPTLTDDLSFIRGSLSFGLILAIMTAIVLVLWESSVWTALFCSSSAYLLQNLAASLDRVLHLFGIVTVSFDEYGAVPFADIVVYWSCAAIVFGIYYLLFIQRLTKTGLKLISNPVMLFAIVLAMLMSIIFDLAVKDLPSLDIPWRYPVVFAALHFAICAFILVAEFEIIYNQALQASVATMERVVEEQKRQFVISSQTIDAINRRVHDMRHHVFEILAEGNGQAPDLDHLKQIAQEINVYDASVKTGNPALDIVLTEKGLLCNQEGISLTCVADGRILGFMAPADLYTLFGMAVDGAIQEARANKGDDRRAISLNLREAMGMAAISIEHYLLDENGAGRVANQERYEAAQAIIDRYGGTLTHKLDGDVFHMDMLIPLV